MRASLWTRALPLAKSVDTVRLSMGSLSGGSDLSKLCESSGKTNAEQRTDAVDLQHWIG